jgi:hypothetical protein
MKENLLSKVARSDYMQTLFNEYKEGRLRIWENRIDLTPIQNEMLRWCSIFNMINEDIAMQEPCARKEILDDPFRVMAYLVYKTRKRQDKSKKSFLNKNYSEVMVNQGE